MRRRLIHFVFRLYPRAWRERYEKEVTELTDELVDEGETTSVRAGMGLMWSAFVEWGRAARRLGRPLLVAGAVLLVVAGTLVLIATEHSSPGRNAAQPTKGTVPFSPAGGRVDLSKVPDFVATAPVRTANGTVIGYIPKRYLFSSGPPRLGQPGPGQVAPVYASDLTTLIGHEYPGIGFVVLGSSPWSTPCVPTTVVEGSTSHSIACQSDTFVLPDLVGVSTPTGDGQLSALGVSVSVVNVTSPRFAPGHIISTSPAGGSIVHARQVVTVENAVSGG